MLQELLSIFRAGNPLNVMAEDFARMLQLTCDMTLSAGDLFFRTTTCPEARERIYKTDVKVNKLERSIRRQVVAHISIRTNTADIPYCMVLISLVKDVERLGDYAKNLSEVLDFYSGDLPDDDIVGDLREIRAGVEEAFQATATVFAESDRERALELIGTGKNLAQRADGLLSRISRSSYTPAVTAATVLGARYYKRIGGHLLNVLTSVVMPLHKIDFYDEDEIPPVAGAES